MTKTFTCPAGHESVDADFCSECGNQLTAPPPASTATGTSAAPAMAGPDASAASASATAGGNEDCPKCSELRDGTAQFCGVCGYDFVNKTGGEVPQAIQPAPVPAPAAVAPSYAPTAPVQTPALSSARIDVEVVVGSGSVRKHSLFDFENLIGRPNNKVALTLTIDGDEGISRKQMMITRTADSVTVRDLDSANGTVVERAGVKTTCAPGEEKELAVGDKIIIGEYTVITVISINL